MIENLIIKSIVPKDIPTLYLLIKQLADYEKASDKVFATEALLTEAFFGAHSCAEAIIGWLEEKPIAFAVFFHNFSTYVGRKGLYLEDIFVKPEYRGFGIGKKMLISLAKIALERNCGRMEWSVLNWNKTALSFYQKTAAKVLDDRIIYRLKGEDIEELAATDVI